MGFVNLTDRYIAANQHHTSYKADEGNTMLRRPEDVSPDRSLLVVMWSPNLPSYYDITGYADYINFTFDKKQVSKADFVFFHVRMIDSHPYPSDRKPWQRWVLFTQESPMSEGIPDSTLLKYGGVFNFSYHYKSEADIWGPCGYCIAVDRVLPQQTLPPKSRLVSWVVSNCGSLSGREEYVRLLSSHLPVDIYGACGSMQLAKEDFEKVINTYKFFLAFENSLCNDYVSEKVFKILRNKKMDVVPVVYGLPDYDKILPPHSYIDMRKFPSASALADYLLYLDRNDAAYMYYFEWKHHYSCELEILDYKGSVSQTLQRLSTVNNIINKETLMRIYGNDNCVSANSFEFFYNETAEINTNNN